MIGPSQSLKPTSINVLPHTLHTLRSGCLVGVSLITYEKRIPILEFVFFSLFKKGLKNFLLK